MEEMVQFHINHGSIDPLNRRRIANGTLHSLAGSCGVTTMNAAEADLPDTDCMLAARCRRLHIFDRSCENFDVLRNTGAKESARQIE
jgi:hypothetical protein